MTGKRLTNRKPITEDQIVIAICYSVMSAHDFDYKRRLDWEIWAARSHMCSTCQALPYHRCFNLSDKTRTKLNKRPHDARVNWGLMLNGLKTRGYYRPALETQVRNQVR